MNKYLVAALLTVIQILLCFVCVWIFEGDQGLVDMGNRGAVSFAIAVSAVLSTANIRVVKSWET